MKKLTQEQKDSVLEMSEYRQGVNKVRITLKNGKVFREVFIAWGEEIIRVGNSNTIPFDVKDIDKIENEI